jgi:membrane protein implicated in regulation of membrane protease activity
MADNPARPARVPNPLPTYLLCGVLLLAPFVALLWVSSYAKDSPRLWGFPFFYWYQFLWVLLSAGFTFLAYVLVRRVERPRQRLGDRPGGPR